MSTRTFHNADPLAGRGGYDLDELKRVADLLTEVKRYAGEPARWNGNVALFHCPNPSHSDTNASFTVDTRKSPARFRCWSQCDARGGVLDFIMWREGLTVGEAIKVLARAYDLEPGGDDRPAPPRKKQAPPPAELVTRAEDNARPLDDPDKAGAIIDEFLNARGWTRETAELVGLSVVVGTYGPPRIRFPFRSNGDALVWQDRATTPDQEPRWKAPAGATLIPFGLDCLRSFDGPADTWPLCPLMGVPAVWIVEGPADAVTMLNAWPAVSVLGIPGVSNWKDRYTAAVSGLPVVIVADNDKAGDLWRYTLDAILEDECTVRHVWVPAEYDDLGDWNAKSPTTFRVEMIELAADSLADSLAERPTT